MSSNTFWTLFFLLIIIIVCELMTLSVRFSPLVMSSLHGYDSSDEMEQVKERYVFNKFRYHIVFVCHDMSSSYFALLCSFVLIFVFYCRTGDILLSIIKKKMNKIKIEKSCFCAGFSDFQSTQFSDTDAY